MTTRPPQPMRPPPDREPRPPAPAWSAGAAVPSSTPGSSNPAPSHAIPSLKESIGSAHASITHAELSGKYTNLKKRYFALDDRAKETQGELMRSMERNAKLRNERNILLDRIIELEDRLRLFESQLQRHDPRFLELNAVRPPAAATGAYPRALASRAAHSVFAANLQRARDELDAEGPRGLERDSRDHERDMLARRRDMAAHAHVQMQHAPAPPHDVPMTRKRVMDESWRAEEEEVMLERENKRIRPGQISRPPFSHSNSGGDPRAGSPSQAQTQASAGTRSGNGIGSERLTYPPPFSSQFRNHASQGGTSFRQSPPCRNEYFGENGITNGTGYRSGGNPAQSNPNSPRFGLPALHESPSLRHASDVGPEGQPSTVYSRDRERYDAAEKRSPPSPANDSYGRPTSVRHLLHASPPMSVSRPPVAHHPYSHSPPGRYANANGQGRPGLSIPPLPPPPHPSGNGSSNTIAIPAPSPTPITFHTPRPSFLQRQTKPKRLKAHTVTSKSHSIPAVPRDRSTGRPLLPLNVGIMTVLSLGSICTREHFHTERYVFPIGYEVTRRYLSTLDPHAEVVYRCTILDGGDAPKFQIIAADMPDKPIVAGTATGAWSGIVRAANLLRHRQHSNSVSGPDYFGLGQNTIKHLIQELPGADKLRNYVWQTFVEGGPLGGRHAAVMPALPEDYDVGVGVSPSSGVAYREREAGAGQSFGNGYNHSHTRRASSTVSTDVPRGHGHEPIDSPIYSRSSRSDVLEEEEGDAEEEGEEQDELMDEDVPMPAPTWRQSSASEDVRSRERNASHSHSHSPVMEKTPKFGLVPVQRWNLRPRSRSSSFAQAQVSGDPRARALKDEVEVIYVDADLSSSTSTSNSTKNKTKTLGGTSSASAALKKADAEVRADGEEDGGDGEEDEEEDGPRRLSSRMARLPPESEEGVDSASLPGSAHSRTRNPSGHLPIPSSASALANNNSGSVLSGAGADVKGSGSGERKGDGAEGGIGNEREKDVEMQDVDVVSPASEKSSQSQSSLPPTRRRKVL